MNLDPLACYRAVLARDARHDGRFFTCVKTTGIYCRPICPARPPKFENCRFVPTAAAAQEAGFRPCLRCRPENSPEVDAWRGTAATVSRAMKLIETGALADGKIGSLADRLGIGERQLRRLFRQHVGAAPVTVAQTHRVLLARQLIHQTDLSMIDVALASGFGSVRRFNEVFQRLYHRSPRALRGRAASPSSVAPIELLLPYRPPYDWAAMIRFLQARTIPALETIVDDVYSRVIELDETPGSISVAHAPEHSALRVVVAFPELGALSTIIAQVRRMFDLSAEPSAIAAALSADPLLAPIVAARPGLHLPGAWDGFEIAVRAVLGQQITLKAATRLAGRVVSALGTRVAERLDLPGLTHAFPRPERFDVGVLSGMGMPKARAAALAGFAAAVRSDPAILDPGRDLAEAVARLRDLPGIGEWTA
ncbi:MAG TPA: DNA-3-methyladenine glycosylase 2 family protein [Gemmataceae bacterium]|nr:DNA-3-methyladenine glycosylase 2 family protein [Gemmataceae bacterium]